MRMKHVIGEMIDKTMSLRGIMLLWCNQRQFEEEEKLGAMLQLDFAEAQARFGEQIAVASLGAIEKKNGTFRVVHDGTHGVGINPGIKMRDQLKSPCAGDIRAVMQELPGGYFGLTGDVARAHRLVKVAEADWGLMACKTGSSNKIWVNRVGSFGISSAAYHWSRLMSGVGRAVYNALGKSELFLSYWFTSMTSFGWFAKQRAWNLS